MQYNHRITYNPIFSFPQVIFKLAFIQATEDGVGALESWCIEGKSSPFMTEKHSSS